MTIAYWKEVTMTQTKNVWICKISVLILLVGITCWHTTFCSKAEFCDYVINVVDTNNHSFLLCSLQTLDGLLLWTNLGSGYAAVFIFDRALGWYLIRDFGVVECVNCLVGLKLSLKATVFGIGVRGTTISAIKAESAILKSRFWDSSSILVRESNISNLDQTRLTLRYFWVRLSPREHRRKIRLLLFRLCGYLTLPFLIDFNNRCWLKLCMQLRLAASLIVLLYTFGCNYASLGRSWP